MSKLSTTDRRDIRKLMEDKEKQLTQALGTEISSDINRIKSRLLLKAGYSLNSHEIKKQLSMLAESRKQAIRDIDSSLVVDTLELEEATFEQEYNEKLLAMQTEYENRKNELNSWKDSVKESLSSSRKDHLFKISQRKEEFNQEFLEANHKGLLENIEKTSKEYDKVSTFETEISPEAQRIAIVTQQSQSRLQCLVSESCIKAKQNLLTAGSYEEAIELIESIPTVSELIQIMEDPSQGAAGLVNRLNPQFRVALPEGDKVSETETKIDSVIDDSCEEVETYVTVVASSED